MDIGVVGNCYNAGHTGVGTVFGVLRTKVEILLVEVQELHNGSEGD